MVYLTSNMLFAFSFFIILYLEFCSNYPLLFQPFVFLLLTCRRLCWMTSVTFILSSLFHTSRNFLGICLPLLVTKVFFLLSVLFLLPLCFPLSSAFGYSHEHVQYRFNRTNSCIASHSVALHFALSLLACILYSMSICLFLI
jgi:hypothetical protein